MEGLSRLKVGIRSGRRRGLQQRKARDKERCEESMVET